MSVWLAVLVAGAGSYLFRISMLVVAARTGLPPVVERAASYAVPVAFAALAAASVAAEVQVDARSLPPLAAVSVAALAARRFGSPHAALLAGMPTLWTLSALVPA
jgi:branched-subunit amino acid transport protein